MAAYAALTSLKNLIHNLHNHPSPPVYTNKKQVESLTEVLTFLQKFRKGCGFSFAYSDEADPLEIRIVDAALKAADVIESKIVQHLRSQSMFPGDAYGEDLNQELELVIEEMNLIKKAAMAAPIQNTVVQPQLRKHVSTAVGSSNSTSSSMVGFDDALNELLESLVGSQCDLQIIPITGMGGIGKTTLARNLFDSAYIKEHFNIRAWATISQDFNAREALKELHSQATGSSSDKSEDELGKELYQHLSGRRYLIVMDDMWSSEVWDKVRHYFPNYNNGSRVIVTTRQSNLVSHFKNGFKMKFLDESSSWKLFSKTVFGEECFPLELEEIGRNIVRNCRGLPLSIVTIGGLLAKSEQTREYWEHIEENVNPIVNLEDDYHCLRILQMSYIHLPMRLKPCLLHMGMFKEDCSINVSKLIKLWISEGFLEPTNDKSLETIAKENLKDLVDRNLVLVDGLGSTGNMKYFKIHDLLRDLCIREAEKCGFYVYFGEHIPQDINSMCRLVIPERISNEKLVEGSLSISGAVPVQFGHNGVTAMPFKLRLWKRIIASGVDKWIFLQRDWFELANSRYLELEYDVVRFTSAFNFYWNLHTLISDRDEEHVTAPIWNMHHLRHVKFPLGVLLPDPPTDHDGIMENLRILKTVMNLKLNHEVVKRIPNIRKLGVKYDEIEPNEDYYCLDYLECLHKLEYFQCSIKDLEVHDFMKKLTFPQRLKKLRLDLSKDFELEEILEKIGALPLLQYLYVFGGFFVTGEWTTVEGQFCSLEFLHLDHCGLEQWTSESSHFPLLKEIHLSYLTELEEIPLEIGDIPTLQEIELDRCNMSVVMSARKIVEEQEDLQGEQQLSFKVQVFMRKSQLQCEEVLCNESTGACWTTEPHFHSRVVEHEVEALERLKGPNFHIEVRYWG